MAKRMLKPFISHNIILYFFKCNIQNLIINYRLENILHERKFILILMLLIKIKLFVFYPIFPLKS